jgi:alanine racemase
MESTLRRTWAEINLDAIAYNYKEIRKKIGSDVKFLGVVKADAYGHGSIQVGKLLQELGADYLAVSSADEALELRVNGITMPILILGHTPKEQVPRLIEYNITQAITCKAKADEYSAEAVKCGGTLKVHIKVDTGMSRLGYLCDNANFDTGVSGITEACNMPGLFAEGIFTHFAVADELGDKCDNYTKHQFELFTKVISAVEDRLDHKFAIRHCANTGAVARFPETYLDMVRPGLLLYGYGEFAREMGLKPAMTLKTTISTIKIYPEGTAISYGGTYVTEKTTRIGVLPYGYADGFLRSLSNKCYLYTKEGPAKLRGKICMDMCMIDITDMPTVDVGSEVEIFGEKNSIDNLAELAGTIPYELTCAVSKRVPRIYYRDGQIIERELMLRM